MLYSSLIAHYLCIALAYVAALFVFKVVYLRRTYLASWRKLTLYFVVYCVLALVITDGLLIKQENMTQGRIFGYAASYSMVFEKWGHEYINDHTSSRDPRYLELIQLQKDWLSVNPFIADIFTMKKNSKGQVYLAVGAEADYNRNGVYDGDRERRADIGELYDKDLPALKEAFRGHASFTEDSYSDEWGDWVSAFIPLRNSQGELDGILGIDFFAQTYFRDLNQILFLSFLFFAVLFIAFVVSVQKHYHMVDALAEADKARQVKSDFLANMSHEIRTPLNGIIGVTELMEPAHMDEAELEKLQILKTSSKALLSLVNDILDFSALEASKIKLERVVFDLNEEIENVVRMMSCASNKKGIYLNYESAGRLLVLGDPTRFRQVLTNLVGNAIKFTTYGGVSIHINTIDGQAPRKFQVSVKDTGIGIHDDQKVLLFKSFSQADASTTRKYGGTGLGLAICKALVHMMGGEIGVQSSPGRGSTFFFTFTSQET